MTLSQKTFMVNGKKIPQTVFGTRRFILEGLISILTTMNVQESIKHLQKIGYTVEKHIGDKYKIRLNGQPEFPEIEDFFYSERKLIKYAKALSSENHQNTALKRKIKKFDNSKNRAATRNLLKKSEETIDSFGPNAKLKREDRWNWD